MTAINAISSSNGSTAVTAAAHRSHRHGGKDPMADVAKTLGMSSDDLRSQLSSGKSLNEVATAKGVSHDDLVAAIKKGMPTDAAGGVDATEAAEKIAGTQGLPKRPAGPPPGAASDSGSAAGSSEGCRATSQSSKLNQLSSLLKMSSQDVSEQVSSGKDLIELLKSKGVSTDRLKSILDSGDLVDVSA